ncbi:MAG: peptidylprolyl isomerase [Pseudomonadota bacterium]
MNIIKIIISLIVINISIVAFAHETGDEHKHDQQKVDEIIAEVNGKAITASMIHAKLDMIKNKKALSNNLSIDDNLKMKIIDSLINEELLYQEAKKAGVAEEKVIQKSIVRKYLTSKVQRKFEITSNEIANYYEKNKPEFYVLKLRHILVKGKDQASKKRCEDILEKIKKGADFEKVAKEQSEAKHSAKKGGLLERVSMGRSDKNLWSEALKLAEGEMSPVFQSKIGFQIIKMEEKQLKPIKQVESLIKGKLNKSKKAESEKNLIADLRKKAKISYNQDLLK